MEAEKRKATALFFENDESKHNEKKTLHIYGVNRGGTTSVAGIIQRLGISIGHKTGSNLEDRRFHGPAFLNSMPDAIADNDGKFDVWCWKFPHSIDFIEEIIPLFRNLRLILVTRDPTAVYSGWIEHGDAEEKHAALVAFNRPLRNYKFFQKLKVPTLLVSYEKLLLHPENAIQEIADFAGVKVDAETLNDCVQWVRPGKKYQRQSLLNRLKGHPS